MRRVLKSLVLLAQLMLALHGDPYEPHQEVQLVRRRHAVVSR